MSGLYHGRTHCPGGTDPIPCLGGWYGEAYLDTDESVVNNVFHELANWDAWNVPYPDVIDQHARGLEAKLDLYAMVSGLVVFQDGTFAPGDTWYFAITFVGGGGDYFVDRIESDVQQVDANYTSQSLDMIVSSLILIPAGKVLRIQVNHNGAGSQDVAAAFLRVWAPPLIADATFDPPP
jgi:hypothetical protein